ncbi:MAG: hypothetical protein NW207_07865 [Cytophagales bacterium]|nr:hypothetical protein [Cytophagales bacterium]
MYYSVVLLPDSNLSQASATADAPVAQPEHNIIIPQKSKSLLQKLGEQVPDSAVNRIFIPTKK